MVRFPVGLPGPSGSSPVSSVSSGGGARVQDFAAIPVGATLTASSLVLHNAFLYSRIADGTSTGSWVSGDWTPVYAGSLVTSVGAPSTLAEGALGLALDGSGFVTGLYLGTSSTPTQIMDATGPILYGTNAARIALSPLPTDGTVFVTTDTGAMYQVRSAAWSANLLIPVNYYGGAFGDGSDGALTFDGSATVAGLAPSSSIYTLTRDLHATTFVNQVGSTIKTAGYRIFAQGAASNAGTISADGNNAAGAVAGTATAGLFSSPAGGAGGTGAGSAGANNGMLGGAASAAGTGSGGAGGGAVPLSNGFSAAIAARVLKLPNAILSGVATFAANAPTFIRGGSGASGGGGDTTNAGGGGGAGGGVVAILAASFVNTGTVQAKGGNGANGVAGNAGGGSGGGGGCVVVYTRSAWTAGTVTVTGGTAGNGVGTGTNGAAGSAGQSLNVVLS